MISCILITVNAAPIHNKAKLNCLVRQLKSAEKLEADFPEFTVENEIGDCEVFLKDLQKDFYKKFVIKLRKNDNFAENTRCITSGLKSKGWADDTFLSIIYQADKTLPRREREQRVKEVDERIESAAVQTYSFCVFNKLFGEIFDEAMKEDSSSSEEETSFEDYCARKRVIDKNLLDSSLFTLKANPENLQVSDVDCVEEKKKTDKDIRKAMVKAIKESNELDFDKKELYCTLDKDIEGGYLDKWLAVAYLSEVNPTDEQKAEERQKFIDYMTKVMSEITECTDKSNEDD